MRSFAASFIPALALTVTMSATMPAMAQQPAPATTVGARHRGHRTAQAGRSRTFPAGKSW